MIKEMMGSFDDLEKYGIYNSDLIEEDKRRNEIMNGNFKVRCVDTKGQACYTKGKIYEIKDRTLINDNGKCLFIGKIISIKHLQRRSLADWKLVETKDEQKGFL